MNQFTQFAIALAKEAGKILKEHFGKTQHIGYKGPVDLVTDVDLQSEDLIFKRIRKKFPDHDILTEEKHILDRGSQYKWIVDPLDGTVNYAHGYPSFCVAIALEQNNRTPGKYNNEEVILGVVYDPLLDELFHAEKGNWAYCNRKRIHVSSTKKLIKSLLATGFPYDILKNRNNNISHFNNFLLKAQAIRRDGSAALDICYTAMGRFDGYWELNLKPWDVAGGSLILEEAGGKVTNFQGKKFDIYSKEIIASNGYIHKSMLNVLQATSLNYPK